MMEILFFCASIIEKFRSLFVLLIIFTNRSFNYFSFYKHREVKYLEVIYN